MSFNYTHNYYNQIANYINNIENKLYCKSTKKDIDFVKQMLDDIHKYGSIGWYENNKLHETIHKLKRRYI